MIVGLDGRSLLLSDPARVTGVHRYTVSLVRALIGSSDVENLRLLFPGLRGWRSRVAALPGSPRLKAFRLPLPDPLLRWIARAGAVPSAESRLGALDVFHTPHAQFGPRPRRAPWVVTIHDLTLLARPELGTPRRAAEHREILGLFARRADAILTGSRYVAGEIAGRLGADPRRIHVACEPVDECFRRPAEVNRARLARELGVEGPYVLYFGHLLPHKNVPAALAAFARLSGPLRRAHALVVAGGPEEAVPDLARRASELGIADRVRFVGALPDPLTSDLLLHLLSGASLMVFPSLSEGFGYPPLEAMTCGVPVVCSNRTALPEIMDDGALLADPEDPDALAGAMAGLLEDPESARALAERGRRRASFFTRERFAEGVLAAYRAAISSK